MDGREESGDGYDTLIACQREEFDSQPLGSINLDPIVATSDFPRSQKKADNDEVMEKLEEMAKRRQDGDFVLHGELMTRFVAND